MKIFQAFQDLQADKRYEAMFEMTSKTAAQNAK